MRIAILISGLIVSCFLGAVIWYTQPEPEWRQRLLSHLSDPETAQIRDVKVGESTGWICGKINAKNKLGGYVGFKDFLVRPPNDINPTWRIDIEGQTYAAVTGGCR